MYEMYQVRLRLSHSVEWTGHLNGHSTGHNHRSKAAIDLEIISGCVGGIPEIGTGPRPPAQTQNSAEQHSGPANAKWKIYIRNK